VENNVGGRKEKEGAREGAKPRERGRPRKWETSRARKQAYAVRRRERDQLLEGLLLAMLNAHWEDPELLRTVSLGDEAEAVTALTAYFRKRHWSRASKLPRAQVGEEGTSRGDP